jgi:hypothetical protein
VSRSKLMTAVRVLACALSLGALAATSAGCTVGVADADYPPGDYPPGAYDDYPPDAYIATAEPVYFEGHATYFYGNRWYYRDGGRWNHYDREPAGLRERRAAAPVVRRSYEPYRGHAVAHPSVHGGGGGHGRH